MLRIWDPIRGLLLRELHAKPGSWIPDYYRAAISPDGQFIAAMNPVGSIVDVWSSADGVLLRELRVHAADFPRLAFSATGWLACTGVNDAAVFDVRTWGPPLTLPGPVHGLAFDSRSHLATGAATGDVALWDVPSGVRLKHLRQFGEPVDAIEFSPDDQLVVA